MRASFVLKLALSSGLLAVISFPVHAVDEIDFIEDIYPLLEANCLECHGPDEAEADFRVDSRQALLSGGGSGIPAVVAGDTFESYLVEVLREEDEEYRMPQKADPLPEHDIALIEKWIEAGAEIPEDFGSVDPFGGTDLWSMQPVERPAFPDVENANTAIDAFLLTELTENGLGFNPRANPYDLLKRTSVLLTGLNPTPEQFDAFEHAFREDPDGAFEAKLDELLASPHFGERWAQHWLDVIRWAETNGSEANLYRKNAWMYRDYVVDAFNHDKPYDQFIREQIAGDQLGAGVATGFLVAGPHVPAATVGFEESAIRQARADRLDEVAQTISASMLGVTVSCARCHNHKFDPISIKDYYSMTAVFEGLEFGSRYPELPIDDPRQIKTKELEAELAAAREILRQAEPAWQEDWTGWNEVHFPSLEADEVRVTFDTRQVAVDELEMFGADDEDLNLAAAKLGTVASVPEGISHPRGPVRNINDGRAGTMNWRTDGKLPEGQDPVVTFTFAETQSVNRLRLSSNRQYFLETDYLSTYQPRSPTDYTVEVRLAGGPWQEVVATPKLKKRFEADPQFESFARELQQRIDALMEDGAQPSFVGQFREPSPAFVFHRGSPESPRGEVAPGGLKILEGDLGLSSETPDPDRRLEFANWIASEENPLTARVMANRIWHHIFGTGIVPTPGDFGFAGALPSHPELLDWLADEFVHPTTLDGDPWSVKRMIKGIMLTDAYRQSSAPHVAGMAQDAGAMWLWRFPPRRVEAEVIRDSVLLASGKLDPTIGGQSYRIHNEKKTYAQWQVVDNASEHTWRRLLYQERMRRVDDQIFTAFDFPDCGQVRAKRPVSTTPLQALNLMNSPFAVAQAEAIAARAEAEHPDDATAATTRLFELVLGREPDAEELAACVQIADSSGLDVVSRSLINTNEFAFLP
jgi:cytochrome c553